MNAGYVLGGVLLIHGPGFVNPAYDDIIAPERLWQLEKNKQIKKNLFLLYKA